ncbi:response to low sulfur 3 [Rhynchospora pubera]|uniref:Response to low sulfur 3 n=1 Tax=Rhynchospora pubera TaxID=906938 RepID=A0AAV8EZ95_9POAL|nr:response to low sulfur 3 [Rhynchospora pubera]
MEQELESLRKRNTELEREAKEGRKREDLLRQELVQVNARLRVLEEAEERLSVEIGELEAHALDEARAYELRIQQLLDQLHKITDAS